MKKMTRKIYNAGNRIMNTYVYRAPAGYVMIDTGYEHSLKSVTRKLERQGIKMSEIKYVFLTHAHDDHAGFLNELLVRYPGIKVFCSEKSFSVLRKGQNSFDGGCSSFLAFIFCKLMALLGKGEHRFPPIEKKYLNRFIKLTPENIEKAEKALGGKILKTPGHTLDSLSLKVGNLLFCGDAAMNGVPSLHRITIWVENRDEFLDSWNILLSQNVKYIVPAHGKLFRLADLEKNKKYVQKIKQYRLK